MATFSDSRIEITRLQLAKDELLRGLYGFSDLRDDSAKATLFTQLNDFIDSLAFLKSEIEFEYGIRLNDSLKVRSPDVENVVIDYGELADFLAGFKKNIVAKQLKIKQAELSGFEAQKRTKFHIGERTAPGEDTVAELQKTKKDLEDLENMSTDAKVMSTTKKITSRLTQSSQILQTTLMQSQLNLEDLEIQDDELTKLTNEYAYVGGLLKKSDEFVQDIKLSAERDRRIMKAALLFFAASVAWVIWCRLLRVPFKLLIYWPLMILMSLFRKLGLLGRTKEIDVLGEAMSVTSSFELTASASLTTTQWSEEETEIVVSVSTNIEEISTSLSDALGTETTDELEEALGKIIDEL